MTTVDGVNEKKKVSYDAGVVVWGRGIDVLRGLGVRSPLRRA